MTSAEPSVTAPPVTRAQRPDLTAEQRQVVLAAAGEHICATVAAQPAEFPDPTLAGAMDKLVSGAFVSLKRQKHLRSCCGGLLDEPITLGKALQDAAVRTAVDDVRFPPLSATELEHLDMEVWLLYNRERVQTQGEGRLRAVTVGGKHGLVVVRGQARGLLLPGVAADNNWDARRFLEQVCVKAGLHPSLWKDDATTLFTFEAEVIRGRLPRPRTEERFARPPAPFRQEELAAYADFCRGNVALLLTGATPNYYLFGVADGTANGVHLHVRPPGNPEGLSLFHFSLRPGIPVQATLFALTQSLTQTLAKQGYKPEDVDAMEVGVTLLYDPSMHGTVGDADLAGIDARHRAVLVLERSKAGLVFDPGRAPEELLKEAAVQACGNPVASAAVFGLETVTTEERVVISTAPRPLAGPVVRPAGVAGRFYPADPRALSRIVDELLGEECRPEPWTAALVPHAGLPYSGRIAAAVFKRLQFPDTVIVLGPKHTPLGMDWAVAPHRTWSLPGVRVESDPELARQLTRAIPGLVLDALAHQQEHAVEVELPFIARLAPEARVVGIAIGTGDLESCLRFADGLAGLLEQRQDRPLLIISSDMNHFATDAENRRLDEMALAALEGLDPAEVYETVTQNGISMCGLLPAVIVMEALRRLGTLQRAERVGYATSADVTRDTSRVVGYAGMLFGRSFAQGRAMNQQ